MLIMMISLPLWKQYGTSDDDFLVLVALQCMLMCLWWADISSISVESCPPKDVSSWLELISLWWVGYYSQPSSLLGDRGILIWVTWMLIRSLYSRMSLDHLWVSLKPKKKRFGDAVFPKFSMSFCIPILCSEFWWTRLFGSDFW